MKSLTFAAIFAIANAEKYEVILRQTDVNAATEGLFPSNFVSELNGIYNENDPTADLYSIIGDFNTAKQQQYRGDNGKFKFRLTFNNKDGTADVLNWEQTSWITADVIDGADLSLIPAQSEYTSTDGRYFNGLGKTDSDTSCYLDGNGEEGSWYNGVGVMTLAWNNAIPGFKSHEAKGNLLEIVNPENCLQMHICDAVALTYDNSDRVDMVNGRVDTVNDDVVTVNGRVDTVDGRVDTVDGKVDTVNDRVDTVDGRIDTLVTHLQGSSAAHIFDVNNEIQDNGLENSWWESRSFKNIHILSLFIMNISTIIIGLFICWKGGLFGAVKKVKYVKVRHMDSETDVEKPINI